MPVRTPLHPSGRRLRKSHLIAFNAQLMALAVVLVMALAAASVLSLDVVGPDGQGSRDGAGSVPRTVPAITEGDAYVATSPVRPKVREVAVHTTATTERSTAPAVPAAPAPRATPTEAGLTLATTTATEHVSGLGTVGVTWAESDVYAEDAIRADVRSRKGTTWSAWQKIEYHDDHGPDAAEASGEHSLRAGTEPTVVGHVDGVQVRVYTRSGRVPTAMRVVLIDPGADHEVKGAPAIDTAGLAGTKAAERKQDQESPGSASETGISLSAMKTAPKPQIYSRAQWGADESIREQGAPSYGTIQTGFVHHTVNANNYTEAQVPALLRGIYAYHVLSRGWRDIGYNFLVDRFGKIWEGRYGGVDRAVIGAHTLGYNEVSFAMSAIGNFDIAQPPQAVVDAYARLFAWKLSMYDISADASGINVKGKILHAINGHRDVGQTACPGKYLYARIPDIRTEAAEIQRGGGTTSPTPPSQPPTSVPAVGIPVAADRVPLRSSVIGDRWPDLLVRGAQDHEVYTVPTGGQFGLGEAVVTDGSWSTYDQVVPVGDVNGDGKGDLLTRLASGGSAGMRYGTGAGTFGSRSTNTSQFVGYTSLSGVGDLDGDDHPDVVGVEDSRIMLFHGAANGAFVDPVLLGSRSPGGRLVGVGDVVAGPAPDLAYVNASRQVVVLPGVRSEAGASTAATLGAPQELTATVPVGMVLLGAADANGDGTRDLIVRDGDSVRVMPGVSRGVFGVAQSATEVLQGVTHVSVGAAFGTVSGIVGVGAAGNLRALPITARIRMGTPVASGRVLSDAVQLISPGDWNGDGKADLITVTSSHAVGFRYGDGEGHYGEWNTMIDSVGGGTAMVAAGDVNGDGHPDLIARGGKGSLVLYRGDGKHGFLSPPMRLPAGVRTYNQLGTGLWSATSSGARLVSSDGGFVPTVAAVPSYKLSRYDWVIGHGDVDGDGRADLLLRDRSNKGIYLLPGAEGGGVGTLRYLGPGFGDYNIGG